MGQEIIFKTEKKENESVLEALLRIRGVENSDDFLNPDKKNLSDPYLFSDMENAVKIITEAIKNNEKIIIWGDFDADGVTSCAILYKTLKALNANFEYFLPDRAKMGHGLNLSKLLTLKSKNNMKVLITTDCGISNSKEINILKTMGVKVIITDHHEAPETLPNADCILNPFAKDSLKNTLKVSEIKNLSTLSGAGVAYILSCALLNNNYKDTIKDITALAATGTIADLVPLTGESRIIAAKGLKEINAGSNKGLKRFFEKFNHEIKSDDIAFYLAPKINAAGRLDTPFESIKLLIADDIYTIDMIIEKLDMLNKVRQSLCEQTFNEAYSMVKKPDNCIVLYNPDWHLGIIGIVASKLIEKFNVPVFLITKDENNIYRASVRGVDGYNISKILKSMEENFLGFGGHEFAGGFSADPNNIEIELLIKKIKEKVSDFKPDIILKKSLKADIELSAYDINSDLINDIKKLEPFGSKNEAPIFGFKNCLLLSENRIGSEEKHIKFEIVKDDKSFSCLYWNRKILGINKGEYFDFIFKPETNTFNGIENIQLICKGIAHDKTENDSFNNIKIFDHRQKTGIMDKIEGYVKSKDGEVKIWARTIDTKKNISKYPYIKKNIIEDINSKEKTLMLFDYPSSEEEFIKIIKNISPTNIHLMKCNFSKNPEEYIKLILGMTKFISNKKEGHYNIDDITQSAGLSEECIRSIFLLLENTGAIEFLDNDTLKYIKSPKRESLFGDEMYKNFEEEFQKVIDFKEQLQKTNTDEILEIIK